MNMETAAIRKILLRIVFWALGLAACFGAVGVIFAGHETIWRIVGTCLATAVGSLVILSASRLLELEAAWLSGVMAVSLTVVEYLAVLGQIWDLFQRSAPYVGMTMASLAATGIAAIGFSRILNRPGAALLSRVGLVASALVFLLFMIGSWGAYLQNSGEELGRWHSVGLVLAIFSILAVVCMFGAGTDRRHWRWLGVAAAALAFAISTYGIIYDINQSSSLFVCLVSAACVTAHANIMVSLPLKTVGKGLLWGTIGAGITTGFFVDMGSITSPWQEEMLGRLAGASAIIAGCGTIALLVLVRIHQRAIPVYTAVQDLREITLVCPRCRAKLTVPIGTGKCEVCQLLIEVKIIEFPVDHCKSRIHGRYDDINFC